MNPVNDVPTLDQIPGVTISEDAPEQTVNLTGISAGGGELQPLNIIATSSDTSLIANPSITYTDGGTTGTLRFTPTADLSGSAVITVTVTDAGLDGDFSTTGDNEIFERTFTVTVTAVNDTPTLDQLGDITLSEDAAEQIVNLTGITAGGGESQPLQVTATSSNAALIANPVVTYSGPDSTGSIRFTPAPNLSGTTIISVVVTDGGLDGDLATSGNNGSFTRSFTVTVNAVNDQPTLNQPGNVTISEDAAEQTVNLTGITAGGGETQPLRVTASSSDVALIANPSVTYTSPNSTGSLKFTPSANLSGVAVITVVVTDGGLDGDINTSGDNGTVTRTFTVTVNAVNDAPTLDQPGDITISEDAAEQTVNLTGITAGGGETQPLQITATSSHATLINPVVIYSGPNSTGSLKFTPAANLSGAAIITVVVIDGGLDGDLSTIGDNGSVTRSFTVTVNAVNDAPTLNQPGNVTILEDAPEQTVSLTGISAGGGESQPLQITATSSNTLLIANPAVTYSSPNATGSLKFTPTANLSGTAVITVVVTDGGLDGDLATTADNGSLTRTFTVTVNAVNDAPTLDALPNRSIQEDSPVQTVQLTGITAGGGETQPLQVTATSSDPTLIPNPAVTYTSANSTGTLTFTPVTNKRGSVVITVSVQDGGLDGDLSTASDNQTFSRMFTVEVTPIRAVVISPVGSVLVQRPQITWTSVPNAVSYNVWIDNVSAGQRPLLQATTTTTTFLPTIDLGIGKIDVFIRAVTANGTQLPWSQAYRFNLVQQLVPNSINPIQPTGLPTITWPAITAATRYDVAVDDVSRGIADFIRTSVTTTSWIPATELQLGRYRFYARGVAADETTATWSNALEFTVSTAPRPIAPVTATFNRLPEFVWSAVSGATSYRLQVRNDATGKVVYEISGLANTSWTPPTALSSGNHSWIVAGFSAAGSIIGNYSTRTFFFVGGRPTITAPIGTASSVQPQLQWQNVVGAATYQVQLNRSFGGASETVIFNISGITTNSFVPPNPLIRGASYRFWVRAVSLTGEVSVWSLPGAFTVASLEAVDGPQTSPAGIPDVSLAVLESQFERPAAKVRKAAVERSQAAVDESGDSADSVLVASAAIAQHTTAMEAVAGTDATADTTAVDEAISDVVEMLLSGGLLLN
ncbi:MAG UNVERIFIED_CONTAM: Ig-like domain-containing protein [Planctomycetaceae bacterium]